MGKFVPMSNLFDHGIIEMLVTKPHGRAEAVSVYAGTGLCLISHSIQVRIGD